MLDYEGHPPCSLRSLPPSKGDYIDLIHNFNSEQT